MNIRASLHPPNSSATRCPVHAASSTAPPRSCWRDFLATVPLCVAAHLPPSTSTPEQCRGRHAGCLSNAGWSHSAHPLPVSSDN
ncbi:hypothetical protein E2C01_073253 [Portunus trituberculatus]|uniref:Uncharacterized protein n=1 Tax=Portunus trituberculatus TaxID=210409 RepID=A0A5B7IA33_PORTR|nr:hypothetical protein [Portunus trituberculatus]